MEDLAGSAGRRNAAIHAWKGYRDRAWGKDELKPVSGRGPVCLGHRGNQERLGKQGLLFWLFEGAFKVSSGTV